MAVLRTLAFAVPAAYVAVTVLGAGQTTAIPHEVFVTGALSWAVLSFWELALAMAAANRARDIGWAVYTTRLSCVERIAIADGFTLLQLAATVPRADRVCVPSIIFASLALLPASVAKPAIAFVALACCHLSLRIIHAVAVPITPSRFAVNHHNPRAFCLTSLSEESALALAMSLVVFDNALAMVGTWVASLVCWALKLTCLANPAWLAAALCVCISNNLALTIVGTDIVHLVTRTGQEAIFAFEPVITGAFCRDTSFVKVAFAMV